jgi:two-component system response regulator HydG
MKERMANHKGHILVVDDEPSMRTTLTILLKRAGYRVSQADDGREALDLLSKERFQMILTDLKMGEMDGLELLRRAKTMGPHTEVIIFTAYGTVESAVEAMKLGAYDYMEKPFNDTELLMKVARAMEHSSLVREVTQLRAALKNHKGMGEIVAKSKEMQDVLSKVAQLAPTEATVLIKGESGTGKELIARAVHEGSPRSGRAFVPINCSNLPESLLESELFGYEKGAFTGAERQHKGLFEAAHGGTLFLDEIGDMPGALQGKILRVLQEREVRRLGSTRSIRVDVRILAATNKPIDRMVEGGIFREDLFYRLNVVRIQIPPLRVRPDDIIPLSHHFLERYTGRSGKTIKGFDPLAVQRMLRHSWPGNVRELENAVERGVILAKSEYITVDDLSLDVATLGAEAVQGGTLKELQRRHVLAALKRNRGNQAKAARELGIGRNTLWRWVKKYGLLQEFHS